MEHRILVLVIYTENKLKPVVHKDGGGGVYMQ
jgi:hypothetical protein